jgi:hypothetical protein
MKLTASLIDFSSLLKIDSIVNSLQPDVKLDELDSFLYFDKKQEKLFFLVKGALSSSCMEISATLSGDETGAVMVFSGNLIHLIESYSEEMQKNIVLTIEASGEKSKLIFTGNNDRVQFHHLFVPESNLKELGSIIHSLYEETYPDPLLSYSFSNDSGKVLLNAISDCLSFVDDDLKNNAIAIYPTKLMASDNLHVYIHELSDPLPILENKSIFLHKKIAKVLLDLEGKGGEANFTYYLNNMIYLESPKLRFRSFLNNKLARIAPPSEEDLIGLRPPSPVTTINKVTFSELLNFFMGFYSSKVNFKILNLEVQKDGINFVLKNSGVVGYNSSHVERKLLTEVGPDSISCSVLFDSMRLFIKALNKEDNITILMDNEHRAVVLSSNRREIYIAKPSE